MAYSLLNSKSQCSLGNCHKYSRNPALYILASRKLLHSYSVFPQYLQRLFTQSIHLFWVNQKARWKKHSFPNRRRKSEQIIIDSEAGQPWWSKRLLEVASPIWDRLPHQIMLQIESYPPSPHQSSAQRLECNTFALWRQEERTDERSASPASNAATARLCRIGSRCSPGGAKAVISLTNCQQKTEKWGNELN